MLKEYKTVAVSRTFNAGRKRGGVTYQELTEVSCRQGDTARTGLEVDGDRALFRF